MQEEDVCEVTAELSFLYDHGMGLKSFQSHICPASGCPVKFLKQLEEMPRKQSSSKKQLSMGEEPTGAHVLRSNICWLTLTSQPTLNLTGN